MIKLKGWISTIIKKICSYMKNKFMTHKSFIPNKIKAIVGLFSKEMIIPLTITIGIFGIGLFVYKTIYN